MKLFMTIMESNNKTDFKILNFWERDYKTLFTKKFENRKKYKAVDHLKVYSFIPGNIQKILIKEGQKVYKGDPMLILESMKMMNIIRVPANGKVKKIYISVGDIIPKEHLMLEFE